MQGRRSRFVGGKGVLGRAGYGSRRLRVGRGRFQREVFVMRWRERLIYCRRRWRWLGGNCRKRRWWMAEIFREFCWERAKSRRGKRTIILLDTIYRRCVKGRGSWRCCLSMKRWGEVFWLMGVGQPRDFITSTRILGRSATVRGITLRWWRSCKR